MMSIVMSLRQPEEIRPGEVLAFWERLPEKVPHGCYQVFRSPNRDLWAWVDERGEVALMWSVNTGQVHQASPSGLYALVSRLGGWI